MALGARAYAGPGSDRRLTLDEVLAGLVTDGLLSREDAAAVKKGAEDQDETLSRVHPIVTVANQRLVTRRPPPKVLTLDALMQWLADRSGLPYRRIDPLEVDTAAVTSVVSLAYARRHGILALEVADDHVVVATSEPYVRGFVDDLRHVLRKDIVRVLGSPLDISRYLLDFYGISRSVKSATTAQTAQGAQVSNFEQLLEIGAGKNLDAEDQHVVRIVDWLLQFAFAQRASDIHLEPRREVSPIRFRIDGVLHTVYELPTPVMAAVTSRIKVLGRMDLAEKRRPQDGRVKTRTPDGLEVELRLSTMPTAFGETCVMRIFDPKVLARGFTELGLSAGEETSWKRLVERPNGIVLVTGPTGSGKTTTLYATLQYLAKPEVNVCTVEDPIEMICPSFNQTQVQPAVGLDFAAGVRTLLRQDPDIIMVGEIRDAETAKMAIQAALTGHLVLSTLHTNDAPSTVTRLIDLGAPHYLLQATLAGIVAQRLVRTLCEHCKATRPIDPAVWAALADPEGRPAPRELGRPVGCSECRGTGYRGRVAIYEILEINTRVRGLMRPDTDHDALNQAARDEGMRPLRASAASHVLEGRTTLEEVQKVLVAV